jgi:hypothetical protein
MSKKTLYGFFSLQERNPDLDSACEDILKNVMAAKGITVVPKVWAYLTKENGGQYWQDDAQSALVNAFYLSDYFEEHPIDRSPEFNQQIPKEGRESCHYSCSIDGSFWALNSWEWRMGAEKYKLTYIPEKSARMVASPLYSGSFVLPGSPPMLSEVVGKGPVEPKLTVAEWKRFLLS